MAALISAKNNSSSVAAVGAPLGLPLKEPWANLFRKDLDRHQPFEIGQHVLVNRVDPFPKAGKRCICKRMLVCGIASKGLVRKTEVTIQRRKDIDNKGEILPILLRKVIFLTRTLLTRLVWQNRHLTGYLHDRERIIMETVV